MSAGIIHHELLFELSYGKDILVVGSICVWISFSLEVMLCIFDIEPTILNMQKKKERNINKKPNQWYCIEPNFFQI